TIDSTDRDGRHTHVDYDLLGRATTVTWDAYSGVNETVPAPDGSTIHFLANPSTAQQYRYRFDAADHRTYAGDGTGAYAFVFDVLGRLQSTTAPSTLQLVYASDAQGHTLRRLDSQPGNAAYQGGLATSAYDPAGRLLGRTLTVAGVAARVAF